MLKYMLIWTSLVAQTVKNLPAMQKASVQSLGLKDPLEKGMATHPSVLAWIIPWTEKPGGLQSTESQKVGKKLRLSIHTSMSWNKKKKKKTERNYISICLSP